MKKLYILGLAAVCGLSACKPNIEPKAPERGDADFGTYMAVGSSHTAGIMDGSYYLDAQENSFPAMLAEAFSAVGGGNFVQPLVAGNHGWPIGKFILDYIQGPCDTIPRLGPTPFKGALDTIGTASNIYLAKGPFGNMGISGSKVTDYLVPGYAMANPFAGRIFKNASSARGVDELLLPEHTFFTMWLGMNDVMDYATAGGDTSGKTRNWITLPTAFRLSYDSVLNTVTRNGAKGVVMTIPDVLDMPFFNVIPPNGLELDAKDANKLNLAYNSTQLHFDVGMNYFVIEDVNAPNGFRHIKAGEYVRMDVPIDSIKCLGWGSTVPMPASYVLTAEEVVIINTVIEGYNNTITKLAADYNIPVSDTRYFLRGLKENGAQFNAANYSIKFVSGGIYSLDGIHFTGRGNALLANSILATINDHYGSSIPWIDVNRFSQVRLP